MKSRAEQRIADYLTMEGIRYEYERGAQTNGLIFSRTFAKPDFYLPDYGVYVEYWGLVDASKEYQRNMKWKMSQYHKNHIKFVSIYPKNMDNLDWVFRAKFKEVAGFQLPKVAKDDDGQRHCTNCGRRAEADARFCGGCGKRLG